MIEQVKKVKGVIEKMLEFDPYLSICGGAPREWFLGREARDVDIFMDRIKDRSCDWHYKMMENILGVVFEKVGEDEYFVEKKEVKAQKFDFDENGDIFQELPLENDLPHIEAPLYSVRQFTLDGITYQVMLVKDTYTTYKNFPTSLSKFVLHGSTIKELSEEELTTTKLRNFINVS